MQKVLVLSNYRNDQQFSMQKFGELLVHTSVGENVDMHEIFPAPLFGKIFYWGNLSKWAGYIDKYLIFPRRLRNYITKKNQSYDLVHIIDHSNAPYLNLIKKVSSAKRLITCHDLIAIRSALGEFSDSLNISHTGKKLQNWIKHSLKNADFYACDSSQTKQDLNRILPYSRKLSNTVHLGTEFYSLKSPSEEDIDCLPFDPANSHFLLHVGSAAWYKNRKALFRSFRFAKENGWHDLKLILVGPAPQPHEIDKEMADWIGLNKSNILPLLNISDETLQILYHHANALLFPSFVEGFGWPPLEAASVGCPVITTATGAIEDLLGVHAKYVNPNDQNSINQALCESLGNKERNCEKVSLPSNQQCRENYYQLYRQLVKN